MLCAIQELQRLRLDMTTTANHKLKRTRPLRCGCNPRVPWAGSLILGPLGGRTP
jgi:hypothetical protein